MSGSLDRNFGLVIAYLLPGFVSAQGVALVAASLGQWLMPLAAGQALAGLLFIGLTSLALGLVVSALRWAVIDTLHDATGLPAPELDFTILQENLAAFQLAVEHNYRYYQFYANMVVATLLYGGIWLAARPTDPTPVSLVVAFILLELLLLGASRSCLSRYYGRVSQILQVSDHTSGTSASSPF
jgi:hypothetical protein